MTNEASTHPDDGEHVIPPKLPPEVAGMYVLEPDAEGGQFIVGYMASQAPDEVIAHLEKIHSEFVLSRRIDVWDVHTDKERWWVLTNPTNLYSQQYFPSMDYLISFHVGLTARIATRIDRSAPASWPDRLAPAWDQWERAAMAADQAELVDDLQTVGVRCREALLEFIRAVVDDALVPAAEQAPKLADFVRWSELLAANVSPGSGGERTRRYLRSITAATWELANWLTHATDSTQEQAYVVVAAVQNVFHTFGHLLPRRT